MTFNKSMGLLVDNAYTALMLANAKVPYDSGTYDKAEAMLAAACVLYCKGDVELAEGFVYIVTDGGSTADSVSSRFTPEQIREYA